MAWRSARAALLALPVALAAGAAHGQVSNTGQSGLISMPDARVAPDGMLRFGYSFADPNVGLWSSVAILPRVEASGRYTRIMGAPSNLPDSFGSFKDKSFDGKFVLWEEGDRAPQLAFGVQDVLGTQIFPAQYLAASKRTGAFDWTLGYGRRRIDGAFGGVRYSPEKLPNWSLVAEYDANDYAVDFGSRQSGAAWIPKGPSYGVEYKWGWVTTQISQTREKLAAMAYVSIPLSRKEFIPKLDEPEPYVKITPRPTSRAWLDSDEHRRRMVAALYEQDFRGIQVSYSNSRIDVSLTNTRIALVSRAVGRAARTILLLSPLDTREIRITYSVRELPVATYSFFELDKLQRYYNGLIPRWELAEYVAIDYAAPGSADISADKTEMLAAFDEHQPGLKLLYREDGELFSLRSEDFLLNRVNVRPTLGFFFNDPSGAFKYNLGLQAAFDRRLGAGLFFRSTVDLAVLENVSDVTQPSNSRLPHVRSDVAEYKRASRLKLTRMLVNQHFHPAERVYARVSGGLYEEMYGGAGGQVLYLPKRGNWGLDFSLDWLRQRGFEGDFSFREYTTVQALASLNYRWPLGITTTARVGQFLAKDDGARFEFKRRFMSGVEVGAWYTFTNGKDITAPGTPNNPYHDKGLFLSIPLNTLLTRDTQNTSNMAIAPWTRDVGQMVASPGDLYALMEKPLLLNVEDRDGLVQFGDKDDDYHVTPRKRSPLLDPATFGTLGRDAGSTLDALGDGRVWRAVGLGLGLTAASAVLDDPADRYAKRHATGSIIKRGADVGNALPWIGMGVAGVLALGPGNERLTKTSFTALEAGAATLVLTQGGKYLTGRARPRDGLGNTEFDPFGKGSGSSSFPSRHVAAMWGVVTPYAQEYDLPALYLLAAATNFARVADRRHWVSDTVGGALLGYATGSLLWHSHRKPDRGPRVAITSNGVALAWETY